MKARALISRAERSMTDLEAFVRQEVGKETNKHNRLQNATTVTALDKAEQKRKLIWVKKYDLQYLGRWARSVSISTPPQTPWLPILVSCYAHIACIMPIAYVLIPCLSAQ